MLDQYRDGENRVRIILIIMTTKALIKILSSVLSTATTKQGEEHNQEQFKIRMLSVI